MFMLPLMAGAMALALTTAAPIAAGNSGARDPAPILLAQYGGGGPSYGGGGMAPTPPPRVAPRAPAAVPAQPRVLTDSRGRTLYIYDRDTAGVSNCYGSCARTWPPFIAPTSARSTGLYTVIKRRDGRNQWAIQGRPLYRYAGDRRAGQVNGNGLGGVWHVLTLRG